MKKKNGPSKFLMLFLSFIFSAPMLFAQTGSVLDSLPPINIFLKDAHVFTQGKSLIVSNALVQRVWEWTRNGFATTQFKDVRASHEWVISANHLQCDWKFSGTNEYSTARLESLSANISDDHHFTSQMLQILAEVSYPQIGIDLRFMIWIYPDGPGIRTQLWAKKLDQTNLLLPVTTVLKQVEYLPITFTNATAIGYYTGTEWRNKLGDDLLRVEKIGLTNVDWASVVEMDDSSNGIILVKESHKCVNQTGIDTGSFDLTSAGVAVSGCGLSVSNLTTADYKWCWATWTLVSPSADEDACSFALKQFDRLRYPIDTNLDVYIKANTWGSGGNPVMRASEKEVLAEIDSVADLGLDALQIDDGWQTRRMPGQHRKEDVWYPRPDWYPQGWSNITQKAEQRGIKMGLWIAYGSSLEAMKWNYDHGHFSTWKFDFANLKNYDAVSDYLEQSRAFVDYTHHNIRINYDVTELPPRVGYFWARECGSIWLENREPKSGSYAFIDAIPCQILRDEWETAKYLNNNRFELPVVNFHDVSTNKSDASLYSQTYAVALGLSGIPVFFQTTRLLSPDDREEIRRLLSIYKAHRNEMFADYIFPVGDKPNNASWTGFQWVDPMSGVGYILVFRERLNQESTKALPLHFIHSGAKLDLEDLQTSYHSKSVIDARGKLPLTIANSGKILFLKYQTQGTTNDLPE